MGSIMYRDKKYGSGGSSSGSVANATQIEYGDGNVADALDILTSNKVVSTNIVGLTADVEYTCPSDGYIRVNTGTTAGQVVVKVNGYSVLTQFFTAGQAQAQIPFFVRKGMKVTFSPTNNSSCAFIGFSN